MTAWTLSKRRALASVGESLVTNALLMGSLWFALGLSEVNAARGVAFLALSICAGVVATCVASRAARRPGMRGMLMIPRTFAELTIGLAATIAQWTLAVLVVGVTETTAWVLLIGGAFAGTLALLAVVFFKYGEVG